MGAMPVRCPPAQRGRVMKKFAVIPTIALMMLVAGCSSASPDPGAGEASSPADSSPSATASPTATQTSPGTGPSPTADDSPSTANAGPGSELAVDGKPASYVVGPVDYAGGVLPASWAGGDAWYGMVDGQAEVIGEFVAFVQEDEATLDQILVVTDSTGEIVYRSPSLGLDPQNRTEPSLTRVRQDGAMFLAFHPAGQPLQADASQEAGAETAQLIVIDETGGARTVEDDVSGYRPGALFPSESLVLVPTGNDVFHPEGPVAAGALVLNAETGTMEQPTAPEGQAWIVRVDGVDVFRSLESTLGTTPGVPQDTVSTGTWSAPVAGIPNSLQIGSTFISVLGPDRTCTAFDVHTGDPVVFEGKSQDCARTGVAGSPGTEAVSPDGNLVLMTWRSDENVFATWVVDLITGEQQRIDPETSFVPAVISDDGEVYGRSENGERTGDLRFPDQMNPKFHDTKQALPTAITSGGVGVFTDSDLPTFFAVPAD